MPDRQEDDVKHLRTSGTASITGHLRGGVTHDEGAAMVEFALVLPLLMLLVVGAIRFGLAFNAKIEMSGAARDAARYLVVNPGDTSGATTKAQNSSPGLNLTTAEIAITQLGTCTTTTSNGSWRVTISRSYSLSVPLFSIPAATVTGIGEMTC